MLFWEVDRGWFASGRAGSWLAGHGGVRLSAHAQAEKALIPGWWWLVGEVVWSRSAEPARRPCSVRSRVQVTGPGWSALVGGVSPGIAPGRLASGRSVVPGGQGPAVGPRVQVGRGRCPWW